MTQGDTKKSFEEIHDAYGFFQSHSNEAEKCKDAIASELKKFSDSKELNLADFGCGAGEFTAGLLSAVGFNQNFLKLTLVEPDPTYRHKAVSRLSLFTAHQVIESATMTKDLGRVDVMISNHALYYVSDIRKALQEFRDLIKPSGTLLITMATAENSLLKAWDFLFGLLGESCPFYKSPDLEDGLNKLSIGYVKEWIESTLRFEDNTGNRVKILRFLMGQHFHRFPSLNQALTFFDSYSDDTTVTMPLFDELFSARNDGQ